MHAYSQNPFFSVEYPGFVQSSSVNLAIKTLGGQSQIDNAFKHKNCAMIELSFRPDNPFAHPVPGEVVNTNNLLLKIVKRKRKRPQCEENGTVGEYTAEIAGVITKTLRFRSMVDYQYQPDPNDPISTLRFAMENMKEPHVEISQPDVDRQENLRLFPPPLFSRQTIPQGYYFKGNSASVVSVIVDEQTGEEKKRLINRMRWKGYGPATIMFSDIRVPENPPQMVEDGKDKVNLDILRKLQAMFAERAVWTRLSLFNQFSALDARLILNSKILLPMVCYVFQDGPWRDTLVRFNYDPRQDPNSRLYQRLYFRNANHPISRPSVVNRRHDRSSMQESLGQGSVSEEERRQSHIFDGQSVYKDTAAFQLCDITDPMLREMIEDPDAIREACHERDGWYTAHAFERIKTVLRHKFFSLLEGRLATDEECRVLLTTNDGTMKVHSVNRNQKLRAGKHNMAKGALRPEDAAAIRLRATLDRNAKSLQKNR